MRFRSFCHTAGLLSSVSYAVLISSAPAGAQTLEIPQPPVNSTIDDKGVDLTSGQLMVNFTPLSIGNETNGLKQTLYYPGLYGFRHDQMVTATVDDYDAYGNPYGNHVTIATGQVSNGFTWNGSIYAPDKADGSALTFSMTKWIYTDRDGVVTELDRTASPYYASRLDTINYYGGVDGVATTITRPDGFKTRMTYKTGSYNYTGYGTVYTTRLQSTNTSTGYQLKFAYRSNTLSQGTADDWVSIAQEQMINNTVDYCDPTADVCSGLTQTWPTLTVGSSVSGSNGILSFTDPTGRASSYTFDSYGRIIGFKRPGSAADTTTYGYYSGSTAISSVTLANIGTWSYSFSLNFSTNVLSGSVATPTIPTPFTFTADYGIRQPLTLTDENGRTTTFTYDARGRVQTKALDGSGSNRFTYSYDNRGNLTSVVVTPKSGSGLGTLTTSATYPADPCSNLATCNKPITTTNSDNQVTNYYYNSNGTIDYVQLPAPSPGAPRPETHNNYVLMYPWFKGSSNSIVQGPDSLALPVNAVSCMTASWSCASSDQRVTAIGYPTGNSSSPTNLLPYASDVHRGDGAISATTLYAYDKIGNLTSVTDPVGNITTTSYAGDRQPLMVISPSIDGSSTSPRRAVVYHYNADGLRDSTSQGSYDPTNQAFTARRVEYTSYDGQGRKTIEGVTDGTTTYSLIQYSYNGAGRLDCTAQRMNPAAFGVLPSSACMFGAQGSNGSDRITRYVWDNAGLLDRSQSAYGTVVQRDDIRYTRDNHNLVNTMTDPNGNITAFVYDGHDRLIRTCYQGGLSACQANTSGDFVQLAYDSAGYLTNRSVRGNSTSPSIGYVYDKLGRVTNVNYPGGGTFDQPVSFSYDNLGRQLSATDAAGHNATFTYDVLGNVLSQGDAISTRSMLYDAAGRRVRLTWSDGRYVSYDYTGASELKTIKENGSTVLASFAYDDIGRRSSLTRSNGVVTTYSGYTPLGVGAIAHDLAGTANDVTLSFTYNAAGQIVSRTANSPNSSYTFNGNYAFNRAYAVNGLNQYTASGPITPTYDAKGNLASAGTPNYAYSTKNELVQRGDTGATFYHDPLGRLDAITMSSVATKFQYDGANISTELNGSNVIAQRYVWGPGADEPLVQYDGSDFTTRRHLLADERGSVIAVTDASGNPVAINSYDEYGIPASTNQGRFQYTGQAWLPELGMYSYKARIYSPTLGRFLQTDPAGYPDGPNWYAYVNNDPVNRSDPTGLGESLIPGTNTWVDDGYGDIVVTAGGGSLGDFSFSGYSGPSMAQIMNALINQLAYSFNLAAVQEAGGRPQSGQEQQGRPDYCSNKWYVLGAGLSDVGEFVGDVGTVAGIATGGEAAPVATFGGAMTNLGMLGKMAGGDPYAFQDGISAAIPFVGKGIIPKSLRNEMRDLIADGISGNLSKLLFPPDRCKP